MKIQQRIALHFALQFIILFIALFTLTLLMFVFIVSLLTEDDFRKNPQVGLTENVPLSTTIKKDGTVQLGEKWIELLKVHNMWLQIIDSNGDVIYTANTVDDLATSYTANELLHINEEKMLGDYRIDTYYSHSWGEMPHYYLFGYYEPTKKLLTGLIEQFGQDGAVVEQQQNTLQQELEKLNGVLYIFQQDESILTFGKESLLPSNKLNLFSLMHEPGRYKGDIAFYSDPHWNTTWLLYSTEDGQEIYEDEWFFQKEIQAILLAGCISLLIAIIFSIWNGYRYGRPLLLMTKWIDRIDAGQFDVFTEKEKRAVFKKSGKVRFKYRLYQEVIQALNIATKKLEQSTKERQQLEKTREEWMAGISHDIRTPLSSIQGYGYLLESKQYTFSTDEMQEMGKTIREKSDHIVQLVNDFSLVFELKNHVLELQLESVELNRWLMQYIQSYQRDLTLQHVQLTFNKAEHPLYAAIDPKWFIRVLDNVIFNAIKHNPENTAIHVNMNEQGFNNVITVQDNGVGIDENALKTLFDRYYRGTNTGERKDGSGLGMNIAKGIVELHNGQITVQSILGKGTTIIITLPKIKSVHKQGE
ncbi:HAMP domain-containing sensor histidine kinase [Metasolibacillus meyeri]|uniref:histidine kinase n=1 Tax=Metasolibacillus meyeri TaxID=1071052 RepID=A0AAW9NWH0_9BACL|nr:HAMP domain-containing sensor histidine kinase [Metasolibacillus meyeri]MEC1180335.1 HAMP domain-containing sensor histidine kinase [Metasolibacillus meyeri]